MYVRLRLCFDLLNTGHQQRMGQGPQADHARNMLALGRMPRSGSNAEPGIDPGQLAPSFPLFFSYLFISSK
jgi:hypothetical protein